MADPVNDPRALLLTRKDIASIAGESDQLGPARKTIALERLQQQAMITNPDDIAEVKVLAQSALTEANAAAGSAAHALAVANAAEAEAAAAQATASEALELASSLVAVMVAVATEALTAGQMVHTYDSTGAKVQKANATDLTKPANGFVLNDYGIGDDATVHRFGRNTVLIGLTVGVPYWLDTTGGAITTVPPSGSGNGSQIIGYADETTVLFFNPQTMFGV